MYVLTLTEKLLLLAVIVETDYGRKPTTKGKVHRRYTELSKLAGVEPVTSRRVLDILKALAKEGVLWIKVHSFGRYGKTTVIKLLLQPRKLCRTLVEDLNIGEMAEEICRG
jgi:Cdc6-like AAA superfamily ATPase